MGYSSRPAKDFEANRPLAQSISASVTTRLRTIVVSEAKRQGITISELVRRALTDYLAARGRDFRIGGAAEYVNTGITYSELSDFSEEMKEAS